MDEVFAHIGIPPSDIEDVTAKNTRKYEPMREEVNTCVLEYRYILTYVNTLLPLYSCFHIGYHSHLVCSCLDSKIIGGFLCTAQ